MLLQDLGSWLHSPTDSSWKNKGETFDTSCFRSTQPIEWYSLYFVANDQSRKIEASTQQLHWLHSRPYGKV